MTTQAFQKLLDADILGGITSVWTQTPVGQWIYLIGAMTLIIGSYIKSETVEVPAILAIVLASPMLALAPKLGGEISKVGFVLLAVAIAFILYGFAKGRG